VRIVLAGVGVLSRSEPLDQASQDYAERLRHYVRFELVTVDGGAGKNAPKTVTQRQEAARLRKACPAGACRVALDERGRPHTTAQLAKQLSGWLNGGKDVVLLQGGATGLQKELLVDCGETWSLSPLTLPHRLARVVALEALYRAFTLLQGEPYHRA
jgi:23S rRNA (pseudouridine1915-N3)-methyltransferase